MTVLVTGAAGFVGMHVSRALLLSGARVIGVDNLNDYYAPQLKQDRLSQLSDFEGFRFHALDLADHAALDRAVDKDVLTHIVHLAAQAGVRYSLENPRAYAASNLTGHLNVLELARHSPNLRQMAYASSSSIYGERKGGPFSEDDLTNQPVSLYAATKLSGEMMSESYAKLYDIPLAGLRFFTVYGPWGRPDMAYWMFTDKILRGEPITLFAPNKMQRDFTFIDDIVAGILALMKIDIPQRDGRAHEVYNLGNHTPTRLLDFVAAIEKACGRKAQTVIKPQQPGDVSITFASTEKARAAFGFEPKTSIAAGIPKFVEWYRDYTGL